jgi:hypothetical protein
MLSLGAGVRRDQMRVVRGHSGAERSRAGLRILIPGYAQWS